MSCNCIASIEAKLRESTGDPTARINVGFTIDVKSGKMAPRPYGLGFRYRKTKADGSQAKHVSEAALSPAYCPWCGAPYGDLVSGVDRIRAERRRQIEDKGYDAERDNRYMGNELALAAATFALPKDDTAKFIVGPEDGPPLDLVEYLWPEDWDWVHFNTRGARVIELAKAGALIAAEIDRRLRMDATGDPDASKS
jgi:hypothetical protein